MSLEKDGDPRLFERGSFLLYGTPPMPTLEIRRVQGDEAAEAWIPLVAYA